MPFSTADPSSFLSDFLNDCGGYGVVDGGLATELERHGADLNDPLWSAKCLVSSPDLIRRVHLDYLDAGADIIISASYQATIQGFESKGVSRSEAENLLRKSVEAALNARDIYNQRCTKGSFDIYADTENSSRRPILVAASIGSYGAYLADGSEYSGDYGETISVEKLKDFHRRRLQVLAESGADLIAFETIPNKLEAMAYAELLEEEGIELPVWFSFSCKDSEHVVSGDPISDCALIADNCKNVAGVGVNCTAPRFVHGLIMSIKKATNKPIVIYPNSGETYDGVTKHWVWLEAGASLVGGCCRTTPNTIRAIAKIYLRDQLNQHK
ncbi:hypothetical protein V2J09_022969 [Rumex salicifolius]